MVTQRPSFNICVLCGSRPGNEPAYLAAAQELGQALAERQFGITFCGSSNGMMGTLADASLAADGYVEGIIPEPVFLKEKAHHGLSRRFVVRSMHERKELMLDRCNAFVVLPGGIGTLEIAFELMSWAQMGIHAKPIAVWNVEGYFDALVQLIDTMAEQSFVADSHRRFVSFHDTLEAVIEHITEWKAPTSIATWIDRDQI